MSVYQSYKPPASGGVFLKIEDGIQVKLRFASEPFVFQNNFEGQISTRYAWVVWNYDANQAQIFQQGVTGYRAIANLASDEEWGDPMEYDIKVKREGTGTDTKYHFSPSPNKADLPPEALEAVDTIRVQDIIKNALPLSEVVEGAELPEPEGKRDFNPSEYPEASGKADLSQIPY